VVPVSDPDGLIPVKGSNDEASRGEWKGRRDSRFGRQFQMTYQNERERMRLGVERGGVLVRNPLDGFFRLDQTP